MNKILTFGVYDYFHLGHLRLFKQCKQHGDYLIVAVQDGDYIKKFKPDAEVLYTTEERVEMLEGISIVDKVVVYDTVSIATIEKIEFDTLALGEDHRGGRFDEVAKWCHDHGKKVVRLKRTPGIASSDIKQNLGENKKPYHVGYTCGVYDVFHVGHLNLLERCKAMCDILVVGVCNDEYVREIKHKEPVYPEADRVRILKALKVVDDAVLVDIATTEDKMLALEKFHFDVLFSGDDWKGTERYNRTEKQFAELGASIEYFSYTQGISTTQIKEQIKQ